ncbi:MAG: hypothetical protein GY930_05650 [bacterium]|nr:hypothetical protein [bacterium]
MKCLLSLLTAALGIPMVALLAAPQLGGTGQIGLRSAVSKPVDKAATARLQVPPVGIARIPPTRTARARPRTRTGVLQTNGPGSLAVVINGRTIAASAVNGSAFRMPLPGSGRWYNLSIFVPATGQDELFILGVPNTPATIDVPLLVGMRQNNVSHADLIVHTTFWDECLARGWYMLAPISRGIAGFDTTGGSTLNAQENTKAALAWVTANYPIDGDRIYGVGFSAGAGLLASYASRHLDPAEPMFAAIAYHTGFCDLVDIYNNSSGGGQLQLETLLGGSPSTLPFEYRRISSLELDPLRLWIANGDHGAWSLGSIPIQIWYATNDTNTGLLLHTTQLFDWMTLNGNGPVSVISGVSQNPANGFHNWSLLDEVQVCNWFTGRILKRPDRGDLLIDRDATYHEYAVQQEVAGSFSRLSFAKTLATNELALTQTDNVQRVTLNPNSIGLSIAPGALLALNLEAVDSGDETVLEGVQAAPFGVHRDGNINTSWVYSAALETLTITESQPGMHVWSIQF